MGETSLCFFFSLKDVPQSVEANFVEDCRQHPRKTGPQLGVRVYLGHLIYESVFMIYGRRKSVVRARSARRR